mmetsp:Transcript_34656/g.92833  ORF Transcript_34656/g.92833 Transcript_34656/m.92833 type:complete len:229 (+) Transcript_34656:422-1108(+)
MPKLPRWPRMSPSVASGNRSLITSMPLSSSGRPSAWCWLKWATTTRGCWYTSPPKGSRSLVNTLSKVVLPLPLTPSKAMREPMRISRSNFATRGCFPSKPTATSLHCSMATSLPSGTADLTLNLTSASLVSVVIAASAVSSVAYEALNFWPFAPSRPTRLKLPPSWRLTPILVRREATCFSRLSLFVALPLCSISLIFLSAIARFSATLAASSARPSWSILWASSNVE